MIHYRAQFQTTDGRTHAVVDDQPITVRRLQLVGLLLEHEIDLDGPVPALVDLTVTPPEWLEAAERVLARSA